jgi:geranylgeranyl diphosphate synthase type II
MDFDRELKKKVSQVEETIKKYLPKEDGVQKSLLEAMNYSFLAGGKRLRPLLMSECYRMAGGTEEVIEPFMAAQEMIHTYSLVHDDLPAMDNDLYRRGKKTTHAVYGEAMAILAGDGLLNYAFETACRAFSLKGGEEEGSDAASGKQECSAARIGGALKILAEKAGIYGMIGGQAVDVEAEKRKLRLDGEKLLFIHVHKTAALIQSSMMIGAYLAGADEKFVQDMEKAGYAIGVAFQIQDDILDITSTLEELGKPVGSDEKNDKLTYVSVYGLERSKQDVERLSNEALEILKSVSQRNEFLEELIISLITRRK